MTDQPSRFVLRGTGTALPSRRLDNEALGREVGMDAEAIFSRTGIRERPIAGPEDSATTLGAAAARAALAQAGCAAEDLDLVLLSTYTPDRLLCPSGPELAWRLGATRAGAFDLNGACSGGVTAILTASSLIAAGAFRRVLVVTADLTTRYVRADDPKTRLVFGDGAAALLLERPADSGAGAWTVLASCCGADGSGADFFSVRGGGTAARFNGAPQAAGLAVEMNGRAVFRFGVEQGALVVDELLRRAGLAPDDVKFVIPHQANLRIILSLIERTGIPDERWFVNIERYGNTASTSVPLALSELLATGAVKPGDVILLVAFGAGLTWSGLALRVG